MIYHATDTPFDIEAFITLGVSVKTEGSIGYFGTGFKFALATLLRTGHHVTIEADQTYRFEMREKLIRGEPFQLIYMNDQPLGFTTQLGRNWQPWMAFRELHSNTLDEGGETSDRPLVGRTVIKVGGDVYTNVYHNRHEIFLNKRSPHADEYIEIFPEPLPHVYYRGVRAGEFRGSMPLFGYNILGSVQLTEDRTVNGIHYISAWAADYIGQTCTDEDLITRAILAPRESLEGSTFRFYGAYSQQFLDCVQRHKTNPDINVSALEALYANRPSTKVIETVTLTELEERELARAMRLVAKLGVPDNLDLNFLAEYDGSGLGYVRAQKIYISRRAFTMGYRTLAGTIYEEYLHLTTNMSDCSRQLQNHLLDRLMATLDTES